MENTWKLRVEGGPLSIYIYIVTDNHLERILEKI